MTHDTITFAPKCAPEASPTISHSPRAAASTPPKSPALGTPAKVPEFGLATPLLAFLAALAVIPLRRILARRSNLPA